MSRMGVQGICSPVEISGGVVSASVVEGQTKAVRGVGDRAVGRVEGNLQAGLPA